MTNPVYQALGWGNRPGYYGSDRQPGDAGYYGNGSDTKKDNTPPVREGEPIGTHPEDWRKEKYDANQLIPDYEQDYYQYQRDWEAGEPYTMWQPRYETFDDWFATGSSVPGAG